MIYTIQFLRLNSVRAYAIPVLYWQTRVGMTSHATSAQIQKALCWKILDLATCGFHHCS
jgi:hypothetical protein